jgi:hypothetical protein
VLGGVGRWTMMRRDDGWDVSRSPRGWGGVVPQPITIFLRRGSRSPPKKCCGGCCGGPPHPRYFVRVLDEEQDGEPAHGQPPTLHPPRPPLASPAHPPGPPSIHPPQAAGPAAAAEGGTTPPVLLISFCRPQAAGPAPPASSVSHEQGRTEPCVSASGHRPAVGASTRPVGQHSSSAVPMPCICRHLGASARVAPPPAPEMHALACMPSHACPRLPTEGPTDRRTDQRPGCKALARSAAWPS